MAVPDHPMRRFARENPEAMRQHMASVRAHRKPKQPEKPVAQNFIKGAIKRPGALTAKAKAAGQSIEEFARAHQHDAGVTGDESRFYLNVLRKVGK